MPNNRHKTLILCAALVLGSVGASVAASSVAAQEPIEVVALDGDTLMRIEGDERIRIRLWGISAPEMSDFPHGLVARSALDTLLADSGGKVTCRALTVAPEARKDRYNRLIARCATRDGTDLGRRMIELGWATTYRVFTWGGIDDARAYDYDSAELDARYAGRGLWRFVPGHVVPKAR